jgi:hypothetical protein
MVGKPVLVNSAKYFLVIGLIAICASCASQSSKQAAAPKHLEERSERPEARRVVWDRDREERFKDYISQHPECPEEQQQKLKEGLIFVGMNREQLMVVNGKADPKNISTNGDREQWIYLAGDAKQRVFYFDKGKLTSWKYSE